MNFLEKKLGLKSPEPPLGNEWDFLSNQNITLSKLGLYGKYKEYPDLSKTSQAVQRVADAVIKDYINPDWEYTSLLASEQSLALIFTHPEKTELVQDSMQNFPEFDFLIPDLILNTFFPKGMDTCFLSEDLIDEALLGTNLVAIEVRAGLNEVWVDETTLADRIFGGASTKSYIQTGVAYIHADLVDIPRKIENINDRIAYESNSLQELRGDSTHLQALQVDNPEPLFENPQT